MTLLHMYIFVRLDSLLRRHPFFTRKIVFGAGAALWLVFYLGRVQGGNLLGFLRLPLEVTAMHWMASVFLLAVALLAADLAHGFGLLFRRWTGRLRAMGLTGGVTLVAIAHLQGALPPAVETYEVTVQGLAPRLDGTTVAVLSDLHAGELLAGPDWLSARVGQVQALQPDLIVLVGDLFEHGSEPAEMVPVMRRLSAPLGVWAVRGNHDRLRPGGPDFTGDILAGAGIGLLANRWVEASEGLVLAGIDDLTSSRRRPGEGEANLHLALTGRPAGATLLLSHTPWLTDRAASAGVDLMLSGHTHAGQIWPFNYLVRTRYPFTGGRYSIAEMTLVVCRGTGTWGPRMRLWNRGEISLITLRSPVS